MIRHSNERFSESQQQGDFAEKTQVPVLAVDIGNSSTSFGAVLDDKVQQSATVRTGRWSEIEDEIRRMWEMLPENKHRRIVVGSVVPDETERLCDLLKTITGQDALVIRRDLPLPMEVAVENPETVGVDRVCCAAAAYEKLHHACVVADVGTAMTVDLVSDDGVFMGGAILPGPEIAMTSLAEHTAALPNIKPRKPQRTVGRNTEEAILSGVVYGLAGALRELVERYASEIGKWPQLILTGGGAELLAGLCEFVDNVVPDLCLQGVALAWRKTIQHEAAD